MSDERTDSKPPVLSPPGEPSKAYVPPAISWEQEFVALAFGSIGTNPCPDRRYCGTPICPSC